MRFILFVLFLSVISAACNNPSEVGTIPLPSYEKGFPEVPRKQLKTPLPKAVEAGRAFLNKHSQARIFFSQNTGEIISIDGGGKPLFTGKSSTPIEALATVHAFMRENPDLYGINNPEQAIFKIYDGTKVGPVRSNLELRTYRFDQASKGIWFKTKWIVAVFNQHDELLGLFSNTIRDEELQRLLKEQAAAAALAEQESQAYVWAPDPENPQEFTLLKQHREYDPVRREFFLKITRASDQKITKVFITPHAIQASPETEWAKNGTMVRSSAPANGSPNPTLLTVPSTTVKNSNTGKQELLLAFRLEGIHKIGEGILISDLGESLYGLIVSGVPIATDATAWTEESEYGKNLRDATRLAIHLERITRWYKDNLNYNSWDGTGKGVKASVRTPSRYGTVNASCEWGEIMVSEGRTPLGFAASDSFDFISHEFVHSIIDATASFEYMGESGALNESIADVMGECVGDYRNEHGFRSTIFPKDIDYAIRDLRNPDRFGDPTHYGDYQEHKYNFDAGGVHFNSGIMNRALTLTVLGGDGIKSFGAVPVARLILESLREVAFSQQSRLEDFAGGLSLNCRIRERAGTLNTEQKGLCDELERAFQLTELMGRSLQL